LHWGLVIFLGLVAVAALINVVCQCQVIYAFRRSLRGGAKTPALSIEEVLERIPDVPYQELPCGDGDDDRETCVICVAPYEPGEACGVVPGCGHVFHKLCAAKWLRQNSTCPLCRAAFVVTDDARDRTTLAP
jgi:hypothetical protein